MPPPSSETGRRPLLLSSAAQAALTGASAALVLLSGRYWGAAQRGDLSVVQTAAGLVATLGGLGLVDVLVHAEGRYDERERLAWINAATLVVAAVSVLAATVLAIAGLPGWLVAAIPLVALMQHLNRVSLTTLLASGRLTAFNVVRALPIGLPLLTLVAVVVGGFTGWPLVAVYAASVSLAAAPVLLSVKPAGALRAPRFPAPAVRRLAAQSTVWNVVQMSLARADVVLVYLLADREAAGVYAAAVAIAEACTFVSTALSYHALRSGSLGAVERDRLLGVAATAVALVLAVGAAVVIAPRLLGASFDDIGPLLVAYGPAALAIAALRPMVSYRLGANDVGGAVPVLVAVLCLSLAIDVVVIPRSGPMGAAVVSSTAYVTAVLILRRRCR